MNPIDPVGPADAAAKTVKLTLEAAAAPEPSVDALAQRFQSMMQGPTHTEHAPGADGPNLVSEVLTRGDEMLRRDQQELLKLRDEAPLLSAAELTLKTAEVSRQVAISNFRMSTSLSVASSSNKSVQTLLKNQ